MKLEEITYVYLIGIGGIGMSALARLFLNEGKYVAGYDRVTTDLTSQLQSEGAVIHFDDNVSQIPEQIKRNRTGTLVIVTPAIPSNHSEWNYLIDQDFHIKKRSEVVGIIAQNKTTIAISGTHGKTTVTSMTAHLLNKGEGDCLALLGGISKNYQSNVILNKNASILVVEADEYDRSFLRLHPQVAVITSMDPDHLDIYGDNNEMDRAFEQFASQIEPGGTLIIKKQVAERIQVPSQINKLTYAVDEVADVYAANITKQEGKFVFDIITPSATIKEVYVGVPVWINIENAVASAAAAVSTGLEPAKVKDGLVSFEGTLRRFDTQYANGSQVYIDDYAHHPEEIKALVKSIRELYPGKKITGIFQPHLYSRTKDFADEFATALSALDDVWLLDIYPAREEPIPGVNSEMILHKIESNSKRMVSKGTVLENIEKESPEVLLTIGAGDIDALVKPITNLLKQGNRN
jgi:UDP-N-acetylmuramate--alanine ligase